MGPGILLRPLLAVVACVLVRKWVVKWYRTVRVCQRGVDPEMARVDMVVQTMGCRKCLVLPLACITLRESGTCPDVRFAAQRTNTYCVVCTQYF